MSQTINPMSAISPMRLRRAVSSTSVEFGSVNSLFNDESWSDYDDAPGFLHSTSSTDLRRAAGSGVTFSSTYGGVSKRPLVNSSQNEPETPMRKVRGQSVSGFPQSGLVTPQSASQSFSSSSLSGQCVPSLSLPSPLDTPLATPMSNSLDNALDYFYDAKRSQDWHSSFELPIVSPMRSTPRLSGRSEITRSLSATNSFIKGDEDFPSASFSELGGSRPTVAKHTNNGVNPFYCPPPCLRARSVSEMPRDRSMPFLENFTDLDSTLDSDGAGASLSVFGGNVNFSPSFEETTKGAFVSDGGAPHLFDTSFNGSEGQAKFHVGSDFSATSSHLHLPSELSRSSRDQSVMSMPDLSRSRSSSTASCNSTDCEKPFYCTLCTKRFRRMEHLRRHQKTHTLERPFKCTVVNCGRRFSRTDNLKAHILTHTKKSGRNEYIEGLAEMQDIKPIKRRNPRKSEK